MKQISNNICLILVNIFSCCVDSCTYSNISAKIKPVMDLSMAVTLKCNKDCQSIVIVRLCVALGNIHFMNKITTMPKHDLTKDDDQ